MTRPAAPGPRIGEGRLRVDAARAIAKLREFQLVERAGWVLEAIRAAVASPTTDIVLAGDANDVWLSWRGAPWPTEDLTRLFDVLVSPEAASETQHLRLLASAVNSGLGLQPAYIDVIAIDDHTATRARYTPDVLVETSGDLADSPLRKLKAESIPVPEGASRGMRVHLRRRVSLAVLSYLLGEPPELGIARAACADIPVPLTVGDNHYHRVDHSRDVIRVPLGDDLDGFLAISDPDTSSGAIMEVAERGVILTRYPLELGAERLAEALPIRMLIDAPRMPTNASRSQVQRGSHPIATAEHRVPELVGKLVTALIAQLGVEPGAPRVHIAALTLLAAMVERSDWRKVRDFVSPALRELADLPLLRDATGAPRPLVARWRGLVYRGRDPVDANLAPWVSDILWVPPGDPAERLVAGALHDASELSRRLRWARRQRRAHHRFFARATRPPTVIANRLPLLRARLGAEVSGSCIPQAVFTGVEGEVCIFGDRCQSELVVLHHGREIERMELDSRICFAAVIDAPGITPEERYRGAVRDTEFARVDRAMRAGVLRAVEAIASGATGAGFVLGEPIAPGRFVELVQCGLVLARSLGATLGHTALASAPAWRTVGGEYFGHTTLEAISSIGVVAPDVEVRPIAGHPMLRLTHAERSLLATLVPDLTLIPYSLTTARPPPAESFATKRMHSFALAVTEDTRCGAIVPLGPTEASTVTLHHRGIELATQPYAHQLLPCKILVDSETIVPNAAWDRVVDEGSAAGDYRPWEIALARAAAYALTGARPLELFGPSEIDLHGSLALALWCALTRLDATELLGADLLAQLRAQRMWSVLGDPAPTSIDLLRKAYPAMIPCVARGAVAVAGFSPLVADDVVAGAVATLAGLPVQEASLQLEVQRHAAERAVNVAAHRAMPVAPLVLPSPGEAVPIDGPIVHGIVGVAAGAMEIQIFIEGRPFHVLRRDDRLPLCAAVEIDAARTMPAFDGIPDDIAAEVIARVTAAAPALLVAIASARPEALGDPGPARTLFARWARSGDVRGTAVASLIAAPIFLTVQGLRTSVLDMHKERLPTTTWTGAWLARETDPPHSCDAPIIQLATASDELRAILFCLHGTAIDDVTDAVAKLQAARRMARGLMSKPTLHGIGPACKRSLSEMGTLGSQLGVGEIALVGDDSSSALLHVAGELRKVVPLDVLPAIQIAIEAPELIAELERDVPLRGIVEQLRALQLDTVSDARIPHVQELAIELTRKILAEVPLDSIDPLIRRNLVRAMFGGKLAPAELAGVPLFETTVPSWIDAVAVDGQVTLFGNVWSVPIAGTTPRPLDDRRLVLRLDPITVACAVARGVQIIDATAELALDALARNNRDKPRATTLALPYTSELLAQVALPGDGVTGPRGVVGVLHPASAHLRGLYAHRDMHPFLRRIDELTWPVVATIDDARLVADRTWENPVLDDTWKSGIEAIQSASARAFIDLVKPPTNALATYMLLGRRVGARRYMRGALWIAGPPLVSPSIHVIGATGAVDLNLPLGDIGLTGVVYVAAAEEAAIHQTLVAVCEEAHGILVRSMLRRPTREPALMAAHAAHALALGRITVADAGTVTFDCFRPEPLSAAQLAALFAGTGRVNVVTPHADQPGILDDGSPLSRVVLTHVRSRIASERAPRTAAAAVAPSPEPHHPLQPLVDAIRQRFAQLGLDTHDATIVDGQAPMVFDNGCLQIAGNHPRLGQVAAALAANRPWATDAVDAVVAHGVTVLNVALAQVTDAAEAHALRGLLRASESDRT